MSNSSAPEGKTLAERICDGEPIQWPLSADASGSNRHAALQILETISRTYRCSRQDTQDAPDGDTWGTLQLLGPLGEGSFGTVYRAFDPLLQREVALKLAHVEGRPARHWINEARRLSRVSHQNVVAIHGAEIHEGRAGIWFERIEGQSLQQWILQQGPLSPGELVAVGESLCAALAAVHVAGLIHGDIKPANVMRETGGRIVLLDFGSSREFGAESLTTGSLPYLAPELLEGGPPSVATDVFALGMTLRFLLTGHMPDADSSGSRLLDLRPDLPATLARCIDAACAKDPQQRPPAVGAMAADLGISQNARAADIRKRPGMALAATAALVGLILVAAFWGARTRMQMHASLLNDVALITRDASGAAQSITEPLRIGSPLALRVSAARPVFVYVLNQDDQGRSHVLYPLDQVPQAVPAGEHIELPGRVSGQSSDWLMDSASAQERFAVIAALERQGDLEHLLVDWSRAGQAFVADDQMVRGIGGLVQRSPRKQRDIAELVRQFDRKVGVEAHLLILPAD